MKQAQSITERLKEENSLEWVQRLNNIKACAREIVNEELYMFKQRGSREKSLLFFGGEFCEYKAKQIDIIMTTEYN